MIVTKNKQLVEILTEKKKSHELNFIPTMGNLHEGHLSLLNYAKKKNHFSILSIYVNPLQFNEKKDFKNYPRTLNQDIKLLQKNNVDLIFVPEKNFMEDTFHNINFENLTKKLCGIDRPGHFSGVMTVMHKFLNLIKPHFLTLGEKDYQQALILKKLVKSFFLGTKVFILPTIREWNGLALSSRNKIISIKKKHIASNIFKIIKSVSYEIEKNGLSEKKIFYYKKKLIEEGFQKINYLEVLDEKTLCELKNKPSKGRIFISVTLDGVRLIDNLSVPGMLEKRFKIIRRVI